MIRAAFAAALAAFLLMLPAVAGADPGDKFQATIAPSIVQPTAAATSYTISITNQPTSSPATQGAVDIPAGFVLDVATAPTATIVDGSCSGTWTVTATLTELSFAAPDEGSALCAHGTLAVSFAAAVAPLGDGAYQWTTGLSNSGGSFQPLSQPTLNIDGTTPDTSITAAPPSPSGASVSFSFTGSDSGVGVAGYQCSLDGAGFGGCTSAASSSYSGLADGAHHFDVRAVDAAGNADPTPASVDWTVDATAPTPPVITKAPSDPSADTTPTFEFTDSDPTAGFWCQIDGGPFTSCPGTFTPAPALLDGAHTFGVKAVDAAQNESPVTTYSWTVDTVHPLVAITDAPALLTNVTEARFVFAANKPGSTYQCALDGAAFTSCASPKLYSALGDGSHTFAVRGVWLALTGPETEYTWTIDTVPPETAIASGPPAASHSASATFTFTSSEAASTFTCRLDGAGVTPCTSPETYTGLGDGKHSFSVQAVDQAGNVDGAAATYSWTISGVGPPTQDLRPPANVRNARRSVGYGQLQLHWRNPADRDFDHVAVFVSAKRSVPPRTLVYTGRRQTYTNKRFKNGLYYRYLIVSYDHAENAAGGTRVTVPPSVLLKGPREGQVVHGAPLLRWTPVRKATFYNVQVYFKGQKVLSAWPGKPRQQLLRRWNYGRRFSLRKGLYAWYVWPGFGPRARSHYGQLLGQGSFIVR
jgi:hypothetical protein